MRERDLLELIINVDLLQIVMCMHLNSLYYSRVVDGYWRLRCSHWLNNSLATQSQGHAKTTYTVETDYIAYMNM